MKKTLLFSLCAVLLSFGSKAQEGCSKYYPMAEGSSFEYTNYNKKGKVDGVTNYTVSSVTSKGSATEATLDFKMFDKKGKELFTSNYNFTCDNNMVKIDYKSLFPAQMMKQYSEMDIEMDISGTDIELPNDLSVGKDLADANIAVAMNMSGIKMNISVDQTNRKVISEESVTTTAGTFDCVVITENTKSKTMGATMEFNSKLWLAEGVGMIKQETYKKNGDLMSKTELTQFSQ
ncbi:hypothetical protein [Maribacter sp. 2308TA10-17]|uniref:TapB family protein n=1 Tax=Maribacter sp. 2308TA10-17 TaxID=3386276 RepID=UPI0039BD7B83